MSKIEIAVLDDENEILISLENALTHKGYSVAAFNRVDALFKSLPSKNYDIVLVDLNLGPNQIHGLDVLKRIKNEYPRVNTIVISGNADINQAVEALKSGAEDFIEKPIRLKALLHVIHKIEQSIQLHRENNQLLAQVKERYQIIGRSPAVQDLLTRIQQYSILKEPVLITGESGTGKELVAANLHYQSSRKAHSYYKINSAALDATLIEDQLFGHEKGAFTGAISKKDGMFKAAHGSSLLIDEIGELKYDLQSKLLRAIQEKEIMPLGSTETIPVDVRLIFATNKDLLQLIQENNFRDDLYYRISTFTIMIPPLRERKEDIPLLTGHFMHEFCYENNIPFKTFGNSALDKLQDYHYPGNIRELKNIIVRSVVTSSTETITGDDVIFTDTGSAGGIFENTAPFTVKKKELEKHYIETQLKKFDNNVALTAEKLGLISNNLYRKMRELGIKKKF